jgi:predicted ATP-dependent endonuclease of OLD family
MRISSVRIQNFRAFSDQTIHFNDYTCLVGPNGGGKSTVLQALNVFFQESSHSKTDLLKLDKEDFHHKSHADPVIITVTFEDLSAEAQEDLKDYYRQGKLIVSAKAEWNEDDKYAQVVQYGLRLGMEDFKPFFEAEGDNKSVKELKAIYATIREQHGELPAPGTKQAMIDALREYEAAHANLCVEIPSADQFYGISKGVNRLGKYIQWVFIPAVKDASEEELESKKTALGSLLERTVRTTVGFKEPMDAILKDAGDKYQTALAEKQDALKELSKSLTAKMGQWAHPDTSIDLQWQYEEGTSVKVAEPYAHVVAGEGIFKGRLSRFGHGMQRSFLLALLEELASGPANGPRLILGCEEPELYQHPPQARHLSTIFQKLSTKNSQVIVCTHSPYFVSGRQVEDIRSIRPDHAGKCCRCHHVKVDEVFKSIAEARGETVPKPAGMILKIQQALQPSLNEIFFARTLVLVEGVEDIAYITTQFTLMEKWDEFRKHGCHMVSADGKSSIAQPLAIANHLKIPTFVVFDSDGHNDAHDPTDDPKKANDKKSRRAKHEKDNNAILKLCSIAAPAPFPANTFWNERVVMWRSEMGGIVSDEIGVADWETIGNEVRAEQSIDVGDINKNSLFIGFRMAKAWEKNKKSASLEKLCNAILAFAATTNVATVPDAAAPAVQLRE